MVMMELWWGCGSGYCCDDSGDGYGCSDGCYCCDGGIITSHHVMSCQITSHHITSQICLEYVGWLANMYICM